MLKTKFTNRTALIANLIALIVLGVPRSRAQAEPLFAFEAPVCTQLNCAEGGTDLTYFNTFNASILPHISGIGFTIPWNRIDNCSSTGPCQPDSTCSGATCYNWGLIDTAVMSYVNYSGFAHGCAGNLPCKVMLVISPENDAGNNNLTTPQYVFTANWAADARVNSAPQDVSVCSDRKGGTTGWPGALPFTGTPGAGDAVIWNVNQCSVVNGTNLTCTCTGPSCGFSNFSGYPVVYEKPITVAYQLFLTALFQHYSTSGTGNGPTVARYLHHVQVGLSSGCENYPYCATLASIPQADWSANASYPAGYVVRPSSGNAGGFIYYALNTGTSGGLAPTWCQGTGCGATDGSIHWKAQVSVVAGSSGNANCPAMRD